nr:zinc finger, CCHC-type [Tanacetum cinerariifolium]
MLLEGHFILSLKDSLSGDCDVEKNGKWTCIYTVESQEYQVVYTRLDIASADVGMLDKFDHGLQTDVQVFVDFDYAMGRSITRYMTLTKAAKEAIWLKGLAIESGFELKIVAGIATGNVLGMEIIRDRSAYTLRVSQSRFYNKKLVQTLLEGHSILSLKDSLSGDCDVEKNGKWTCIYMVESPEYQVVYTRLDIASADVGMLDKFDRGLQTDVQVFVDFDYAMVATVEKIYAHESLTFNNAVACEVISKWKAGLKDDMDARSYVYVLSKGHMNYSDDNDGYYWKYTLDKFEGHDFRRWQKKMHFLLMTLKVVYVLTIPMSELLEDATVEAIRIREKILGQYTQHGLKMEESISVSSVIDKLPPSWKDLKHTLKHDKDDLSLVQLGSLAYREISKGAGK